MSWDTELQTPVCPRDKKYLLAAKAVLKTPCDGRGQPINIKGCYEGIDAPDNLSSNTQ